MQLLSQKHCTYQWSADVNENTEAPTVFSSLTILAIRQNEIHSSKRGNALSAKDPNILSAPISPANTELIGF